MSNLCVSDGACSRCTAYNNKNFSVCDGYEKSKSHGRCIWDPFEDQRICTNFNLQFKNKEKENNN
jgi:hypothetical protein